MRWGWLAARVCSLLCASLALATGSAAPAQAASRLLVLSPADEAAYQDAYSALERQDWPLVRLALRRIEDTALEGPLTARLLSAPGYPAQPEELAAWLQRFGDQPLAEIVRSRAKALDLRPPAAPRAPRRRYPDARPSPPGDTAAARAAIEAIVQDFARNAWAEAEAKAQAALSGPRSGEARHWLGLLAWRRGDTRTAAAQFEAAAAWPYHARWDEASAWFWAARARMALGEAHVAMAHLRRAAGHPQTLYGQLAEAQLGRESAFDFALPPQEPSQLANFLMRHPGARRAAALAQLGRLGEAEAELEALHGALTPAEDPLFLALAEALAAPRAQLRVAEYGGPTLAAGFCPTHSFAPQDGYSSDPAALVAVMRQESRFTPIAVSRSNAQGLMQLLPSTAEDLVEGAAFRRDPSPLKDPGLNVALGQDYLEWLLARPVVDGDLTRAFAAYNGGPGWLARWLEAFTAAEDPLLLLEAMPRAETRGYAERVFAYFVVCRRKERLPAKELDLLASGQRPRLRRAR